MEAMVVVEEGKGGQKPASTEGKRRKGRRGGKSEAVAVIDGRESENERLRGEIVIETMEGIGIGIAIGIEIVTFTEGDRTGSFTRSARKAMLDIG